MAGCYTQLTLADRRLLHRLVDQKVTINEIARRLGRHRSTIYREIHRNTFHDNELPEYTGYFGTIADELRRERRRRLRKLRRYPDLRAEVIRQLEARWSPEQIAGRLVSERLSLVRVCAETIYRFIYSKEDYQLGLYQYLPEARRKRRPLRSRKPRDGAFPASHRISQRPDFIGNRSQFGHWEGDLIIFERPFGHANVTSLVERKSRYTVLIKNPSRHSRPIMDKIVRAFSRLPAFARQASRLIVAQSSRHSGLWKMVSVHEAGSVIQAHPGRKAPSKTPTSASAAFCRRTPTSASFRKQP